MEYFGLLRPRKLPDVRAKHVSFRIVGKQYIGIIANLKPKPRKPLGKTQLAIIYEVGTMACSKWRVEGMHPDTRPWSPTRFGLSKLPYLSLQHLGPSRLHFAPGCPWAKRATNYNIEVSVLGQIQFMGRWMQGDNLGAYILRAMSMVVRSRLERSSLLVCSMMVRSLEKSIANALGASRRRLGLHNNCSSSLPGNAWPLPSGLRSWGML